MRAKLCVFIKTERDKQTERRGLLKEEHPNPILSLHQPLYNITLIILSASCFYLFYFAILSIRKTPEKGICDISVVTMTAWFLMANSNN